MNFNGVFDDWNYMTRKEIEEFSSLEEYLRWEKHILEVDDTTSRLDKSEVDEAKAWVYKPQFMDYVVRGMRNFLKSPFKS